MSEQPTGDTPEAWGAAAHGYATHAPRLMGPFAADFADLLDLNDRMHVIEVAAGAGALTTTLSNRAGSVLATDYAPGMIAVLKDRIAAENLSNVECRVMDGQSLDLEDASFDRAACSFGLMLFAQRAAGFGELFRVLKPGGRVMVSAWAGPDQMDAFTIFATALKQAFPDMPPPPKPPSIFSLANSDQFRAELADAGFADVQMSTVTKEMVVETADDAWEIATAGAPPIISLLARVGEQGRKKVRQALDEVVQAKWPKGPIRLVNTAIVGTATRD